MTTNTTTTQDTTTTRTTNNPKPSFTLECKFKRGRMKDQSTKAALIERNEREATEEYILMNSRNGGQRLFAIPSKITGANRNGGTDARLFCGIFTQEQLMMALNTENPPKRAPMLKLFSDGFKVCCFNLWEQREQIGMAKAYIPIEGVNHLKDVKSVKAMFNGPSREWEMLVYHALLKRFPRSAWHVGDVTIKRHINDEEIIDLAQFGDVVVKTTEPMEEWFGNPMRV